MALRHQRNALQRVNSIRLRLQPGASPLLNRASSRFEVVDFVSREPSLEETFLAEYRRDAVEVA